MHSEHMVFVTNPMASINTSVASILGSYVTELYEGSLLWVLI